MTERWRGRAHNIADMRALARAALPRPVFDFADGAAEDEFTLRRNEAAFAEISLLPMPLNGPATRDLQSRPVRKAAETAGTDRPDRARRAVLAGWRTGGRPRRDRGRHRLLPQPWLGLHARTTGRNRRGAALDAGFRLSRPRLHARTHRARASGRIRRAGADHRQPDPRQPRARRAQRVHHPAALRTHRRCLDGAQTALARADAPRIPPPDVWQLRQAGRKSRHRHARRPDEPTARSVDELGRCRRGAKGLARATYSQRHSPPGRSARGGGARRRRR